MEAVKYHGAKQAITLAMTEVVLMFACKGDFLLGRKCVSVYD